MKKIKNILLAICCSACCCITASAQDSLSKSGYSKAPPPTANPKQLNRTTASKDLNANKNNQYAPAPAPKNAAPSNPYGTLPKKPAGAPDNQISSPPSQSGYDDVPPPPAANPASGNYDKVPPIPNSKQLNRTTPSKDVNANKNNQYTPAPAPKNAASSNPYGTLPKKPAGAPDNQINDAPAQSGYDDVPPPPAAKPASGNYDKVPPIPNPKQLNRAPAASKDLNTQVQQKATNQYGPPPVSGSAASNPKSQYGKLPPPGRTQQYGPAPVVAKPAAAAAQSKPAATSTRTQQYGPAPSLPKTPSPATTAPAASGKKG